MSDDTIRRRPNEAARHSDGQPAVEHGVGSGRAAQPGGDVAHHPGASAPARGTTPRNRCAESGAQPQVRQAIIAPPTSSAPAIAAAEQEAATAEAQRAAASAEIQRVAAAQEAQRATVAAQEAQRSAAQALAAAQTTSTVADSAAAGGWWERTSIGGYGELHYEGGSRDLLDFHRFVLFVGHEFNNRIRFFSEIELEHAWSGEGRPGEVELEQAYLQIDLSDQHRLNAGVMLIPSGFLNEIHEPPTFYGVERNPVETAIIPTTWWEGGIGLSGNFGASGIAYNLMFTSGLRTPLTGSNAFLVRSGRQKSSQRRCQGRRDHRRAGLYGHRRTRDWRKRPLRVRHLSRCGRSTHRRERFRPGS